MIAVHPMTQMLEEEAWKQQAARELGLPGQVQWILRLGYLKTYPDPVSLRRPVSWFVKSAQAFSKKCENEALSGESV